MAHPEGIRSEEVIEMNNKLIIDKYFLGEIGGEKYLQVEFKDGKRLNIFTSRASDVSEGLSHIVLSVPGPSFDAMLYVNVSRPLRKDGPRTGFYETRSSLFVTQKDFAGYLKPIVELGDSLFKSGNFNRDWEVIAISRFCISPLEKLSAESYPHMDSLIPRKQ